MAEGKFYGYDEFVAKVGFYEAEKLGCGHKHDDGKIDLRPLQNGKVHCNLCGKEFCIVDGDRDAVEQGIQNACDVVNDIVQTIKLLGNEKGNEELYQFEFTLHKLLDLYIKAKRNFDAKVKDYQNKFSNFDYSVMAGTFMSSSETKKEEK